MIRRSGYSIKIYQGHNLIILLPPNSPTTFQRGRTNIPDLLPKAVKGTIQNYSFNFNPVTGNLNWRQNNKYTGLREDFQYDDLDRLTDVLMNSDTTLAMTYDGNTGGLTGKSDAGTFTFVNPARSVG